MELREGDRILITRTQPGASVMADALAEAGYAPVVCPVMEIEPVSAPKHDALARGLDRFDVVIALSPAAVREALALLRRHWSQLPAGLAWVAVGAATAEALGELGIEAERPAEESSEGMLELPLLARPQGRRLLLLCGEGGRSVLAQTLRERGAEVARLECYRRIVPRRSPLARDGIQPEDIAAIVVSSGEGGEALARFWREAGGSPATPVIAPSERVAAVMRSQGFASVQVSPGASPRAVLALLRGGDGS